MKKAVIEITPDQELELNDIRMFAVDMMQKARYDLDEKLNRIGNGSPTAMQHINIKFAGFVEKHNNYYKDGYFSWRKVRKEA